MLRDNKIQDNKRDGVVIIHRASPDLGTSKNQGGNIIANNSRYNVHNATNFNTMFDTFDTPTDSASSDSTSSNLASSDSTSSDTDKKESIKKCLPLYSQDHGTRFGWQSEDYLEPTFDDYKYNG